MKVGQGDIVGKWNYQAGLASANYQTLSGTLDSTAWVEFDEDFGDEIKPFTTCVIDPVSGKVVPFDDGEYDSKDVYLTVDWIYELSKGDQVCALFEVVTVKYGIITETDTVTWGDCSRIIIRPEEV